MLVKYKADLPFRLVHDDYFILLDCLKPLEPSALTSCSVVASTVTL